MAGRFLSPSVRHGAGADPELHRTVWTARPQAAAEDDGNECRLHRGSRNASTEDVRVFWFSGVSEWAKRAAAARILASGARSAGRSVWTKLAIAQPTIHQINCRAERSRRGGFSFRSSVLSETAVESTLEIAGNLRVIPNADRLGGIQTLVKFHAQHAVPNEIPQERSPRSEPTSQQWRHYFFDPHAGTLELIG